MGETSGPDSVSPSVCSMSSKPAAERGIPLPTAPVASQAVVMVGEMMALKLQSCSSGTVEMLCNSLWISSSGSLSSP